MTEGPRFSAEYDEPVAQVNEPVRVRYAPSPTGALHLGGARTALFNYLFARQKSGQFLLRIEDTDRARLKPGSQEQIEEGLQWLDLTWDETPLIQSERKAIYQQAANELLESGGAYRCFCTPQRLEQMRAEQRAGTSRNGTIGAAGRSPATNQTGAPPPVSASSCARPSPSMARRRSRTW